MQAVAAERAVQQALHAQVVGQATVDQVDVGLALDVEVGALVGAVQARPETRAGIGGLQRQRVVVPALAVVGIVLERHRAEQQRHGRRRGHRKRQRHRAEVRANQRELVPGEFKAGAQRHVGGADEQLRVARAAFHIAKGLAAIQVVQAPRQQVRAAQPGRSEVDQVAWPQRLRDQAVLKILAQKRLLETRQAIDAVGGKVGCNDAAARDAADHVGGVQQRGVNAIPVVARLLQGAQHAKAESRCARTAARQRDRHQHARVARGGVLQRRPARFGHLLGQRQRLVHPGPHRRARAQQQRRRSQRSAARQAVPAACSG